MLLDRKNMVSYKQAITVSAPSTDVIDLGPPMWTGFAGSDKDIDMFFSVDQAFLAAGAATLQIDIQSSPVSDFSSGVVTHWSSGAIPKTQLTTTGKQALGAHLPPDVQRYVRANYTVGTGPFTAGQLTLGTTAGRQTNS